MLYYLLVCIVGPSDKRLAHIKQVINNSVVSE